MSYHLVSKIHDTAYKTYGMYENNTYEYWFCDEAMATLHRIDGPAVMRQTLSLPGDKTDVYQEWWYMGKQIACHDQKTFERILKLKVFW